MRANVELLAWKASSVIVTVISWSNYAENDCSAMFAFILLLSHSTYKIWAMNKAQQTEETFTWLAADVRYCSPFMFNWHTKKLRGYQHIGVALIHRFKLYTQILRILLLVCRLWERFHFMSCVLIFGSYFCRFSSDQKWQMCVCVLMTCFQYLMKSTEAHTHIHRNTSLRLQLYSKHLQSKSLLELFT